ncbi:MAG: alpha/beta hydrolase [Polyangiaceae bacterium]|nr:alpha/beta hydrolase [Polyangiaceae bacterium]
MTARGFERRGLSRRRVRAGDVEVNVFDGAGEGRLPQFVVQHGLGSSATALAPVVHRLVPHARRLTAVDLPGHGDSPDHAERLTPEPLFAAMTEVYDRVIEHQAVLVGNSLGGGVALRYAIHRPEKVAALVLVSPAGARVSEEDLASVLSRFEAAMAGDALALATRLYHAPPWYLPIVARDIQRLMLRKAVGEIVRAARVDDSFSPEELSSLKMPVLVLWGRSERLLPPSALEYLRAHLPRHALVEEPYGLGHCPHFDDPSWVSRRILKFSRDAVGAR